MKKMNSFSTVSDEQSSNNVPVENFVHCDTLSQRDKRAVVLHLLYAMDSFDYQASLESITENFSRGFSCIVAKDSTIFLTAQAVIDARQELDEALKPLLANWRFERISACTRLILRLALWELMQAENPPSIIINEAIELSKCFAEADAYKFVNGVLDSYLNRKE